MATNTSGFHVDDPKHQCCCGCCHVVTGTKIFLFLYALGAVPEILVGLPASLLGGIIPIVIIIITLIGLHKEEPGKMWPFIILSGITFVLVFIVALMVMILSLFSAATIIHGLGKINKEFDDETKYESGALFVILIIMIELTLVIVLAFSFWQLRVVLRCKQYFEEKRWAGANAGQQNQYTTHSTALLQQQQPIIVSNVPPTAPPSYSAVMTEEVKKY